MTGLVSVVIPAFNRKNALVRAVDSVLAQDYAGIEAIVVDDGSTDGTQEWADGIGDARVRCIRLETNRGGGAARNAGILAARGRYVAFLDSDDEWEPGKISAQVKALEAEAAGGNEKVVVYTRIGVSRKNGRVETRPERGIRNGEPVGDYLFVSDGLIQTSSLLMTADLAREVMFDERLPRHQDFDFCLRLEEAGCRFLMCERPLTIWYHDDRKDRISTRKDPSYSWGWARERAGRLGNRGYQAFLARVVVPQMARRNLVTAFGIMFSVLASGCLPSGWIGNWLKSGLRRRLVR